MLFQTLDFAIFLLVVWPAALLVRRLNGQNVLLLVASYAFYGMWDWRFLPLLLFSTVVDYEIGRRLDRTERPAARRALLIASCVANLGVLGFFKYWTLVASTANGFAHWLGVDHLLPQPNIILPIGISFFTLQSMAYTIDVYRREFRAWPSFRQFALYVSFFPQLIAGPIERPRNLLPQIAAPRIVSWSAVEEGLFLFCKGWLLKSVADALAEFSDPIYAAPGEHSAWVLLWAMYGFTFQLYCDFLGYSQMARGLARFFGLRLMENFNVPYLAQSVREFWRRWHISLSTWLRDYLYRSLGGRHGSTPRILGNLMVTMILSGLWHGAAWQFAAWGLLHGVYLVVDQGLLTRVGDRIRNRGGRLGGRLWAVGGVLVTFHAWAVSMLLFRAQESPEKSAIAQAWDHAVGLTGLLDQPWEAPPRAMALVAAVVLFDILQQRKGDSYWCESWGWPLRGALIGVLAVAAFVLASGQANEFIYFQF